MTWTAAGSSATPPVVLRSPTGLSDSGAIDAGSVDLGVEVSGAGWVGGGMVDFGSVDAQPTASTTHGARRRRTNICTSSYGCEPAGIGRPVDIEQA